MEQIKWPFLKQTWGIEFESSKGAYLYTKDGRKILDAAGGAIVNNIGYGREEVADAISRAVINNSYILPPFLTPESCLLYTSPSPRDATLSRMPSSA